MCRGREFQLLGEDTEKAREAKEHTKDKKEQQEDESRVATLLENLEKSGNWNVVRENELLQLFSCRDYCSDNNLWLQ